jgi:hypothetical protein
MQNMFITDNPIPSSERMLHKDYDCKGSVASPFPFTEPMVLSLKGLGTKMN